MITKIKFRHLVIPMMPARIFLKQGSGYVVRETEDLKETTEKINEYLSMMGGSATYTGNTSSGSITIRMSDVGEMTEDSSIPGEKHIGISNSRGKLVINENGRYGLRIQFVSPDGDVPISILFDHARVLRTSTRGCGVEIRLETYY